MELDFYISKNGRYMMLENIIFDRANNTRSHIDNLKLSELIDIVGENIAFLSKDIKADLMEISSFTRKTAYHVVECFTETDDKLSLMMEYEVKFGSSLLTESVVNPEKLVLETWEWIKEQALILEYWGEEYVNKAVGAVKSAGNYVYDKAKSAGTAVVNTAKKIGTGVVNAAKTVGNGIVNGVKWVGSQVAKGFEWVKGKSFDYIMTKIRDGLYSGVGMAVQIFLQFTGVGNVAVAIIWGCMLMYDLYKAFSGQPFEWLDIIFDVMGMLSGGAVKVLQGAVKAAGITKGMSMAQGVSKLAKNPATKGFMATISKGASSVFNMIKTAGDWLAKNLGLKWVGDVISKAGTWLNANLIKPIVSVGSSVVKGSSAVVKGTEKVIDKALQKTGNVVGLKNLGGKTLSKTNKITVGDATRQSAIQGTKEKAKSEYIYSPGFTKASEMVKGKGTAAPAPNEYGLANDVSDELDAALG